MFPPRIERREVLYAEDGNSYEMNPRLDGADGTEGRSGLRISPSQRYMNKVPLFCSVLFFPCLRIEASGDQMMLAWKDRCNSQRRLVMEMLEDRKSPGHLVFRIRACQTGELSLVNDKGLRRPSNPKQQYSRLVRCSGPARLKSSCIILSITNHHPLQKVLSQFQPTGPTVIWFLT